MCKDNSDHSQDGTLASETVSALSLSPPWLYRVCAQTLKGKAAVGYVCHEPRPSFSSAEKEVVFVVCVSVLCHRSQGEVQEEHDLRSPN